MLAQNEISNETTQQNRQELQAAFADSSEWLLSCSAAKPFAVQADEIEVSQQGDKIFLGCLTARGWQTWQVLNWQETSEKLTIKTLRKLTAPSQTLEFTKRISVNDLRDDTNAARVAAANELAEIARKTLSNHAKIKRVGLNQSNVAGKVGTIARILLELPNGKTIAVCGSVVGKAAGENLLTHAILWFTKLQERGKTNEIWIVADETFTDKLQKLHALLRDGWRRQIKVYQRVLTNKFSRKDSKAQSADWDVLLFVEPLAFTELLSEKPINLVRPKHSEISKTAATIVNLAPDSIDVVRARHGETVRFNGLPFARIRQIMGEEQVWFGVDGKNRPLLSEATFEDFGAIIDNLRQHRRFDANDKRNSLYKLAAESWLESILRRDVSRLDPNLVLAPLHAQFRVSSKTGALDLLALRTDGRLVVVELKTSADREHVFQAANYWRQIEQQRRAGNIRKARIFGDLEVLDLPPLIYLVAPLMSFHSDFEILANAVSNEIEIWRFDLNEDWRDRIRVARRMKLTK